MATITVRISDSVRDALQTKASEEQQTLSDFVRNRLEDAVFDFRQDEKDGTNSRKDLAPGSLSLVERQTLALLHRILGRVLPEDSNDTDGDKEYQLDRAKVLEQGFTKEYSTEFIGVEAELSGQQCDFVMDVLDMFRIAAYSLIELKQDGVEIDSSLEKSLQFFGFDHNDSLEAQMSDYVRFLVKSGKWLEQEEFILGPERGNSYGPSVPVYSRMLSEYRQIKQKQTRRSELKSYLLNENELRKLAGARVHPSRR